MSRNTSPYIVGDHWLDYRRDGKASGIWQIATARGRTIVYRSTRQRELERAKAAIDAHVAQERALTTRQAPIDAGVAPILVTYWKEKGARAVNWDQTSRSLRTFLAFLLQDRAGAHAVVTDMTPVLFERFREWRMGPHSFEIDWFEQTYAYKSDGVSGATVQRNINDVRAAVHHAEANMRITMAPRIADVDQRYQSAHKDRILTEDELARIVWYSAHNRDLFRFVLLQITTSVRPMAALKFDPRTQYDDQHGLIDLQPGASPQTKKRNAIIPAIRPMRVVLREWAKEEPRFVSSHKTAWRNMRRVLDLDDDVVAKTIRYTIATWLYEMEWVPERQISEMLGHIDDSGRGLARTSRIYAKYRPERMGLVVKALTIIWIRLSLKAREYGAGHMLSTGMRGDPFLVKKRPASISKYGVFAGGRGKD